MVNENNYHASDFKEVVAQLKQFGVESIRNGETNEYIYKKTSELTRKTAFSDAKLTEYSVIQIFPTNYQLCKQYVEKDFLYPEGFGFDDLLALWLYIAWRMSMIIQHGDRIKVYFENNGLLLQVIRGHYSQKVRVYGIYNAYGETLEINCMREIEEVFKLILQTKLVTDVTIDKKVS